MAKELTTKDLYVAKVAEKLGTTKVAAREALDAVYDVAKEILSQPDQKITIQGFATFTSEIKPAHTMVNNLSETKELIEVPARLRHKATFSKSLSA